eukprot:1141572-Pelagomonas_calceolata.AAC.2
MTLGPLRLFPCAETPAPSLPTLIACFTKPLPSLNIRGLHHSMTLQPQWNPSFKVAQLKSEHSNIGAKCETALYRPASLVDLLM